jgi:hypothetical protein
MERNIKVPSPQEIEQSNEHFMSEHAYQLLLAIITILREKYVGRKITVKLKEIKAKAGVSSESNDDWEKMEHELRKVGWAIGYESPDRDQNFDSYYQFSQKK